MISLPLRRDVGEDEDGLRVDVALSAWMGEPRARSQQRLAGGQVVVDGLPVTKSRRLRAGERVEVHPDPPPPAGPPPPTVPVRFADEHLMVVAKPAGLVVHPGAGTSAPTLVEALRAMGVDLPSVPHAARSGIVHRLDRGTSGLLVVAKTEQAYRALAERFRRHAIDRRYWALVEGVPQVRRATVDAPIARHPTRRTRFRADPSGRRAVSHYDVEEAFGKAAVLAVALETGRTHQVRVHLSAIGHPVAGDVAYGASPALRAELGLSRPALHARHLGFDHPVTRERLAIDEPLPPDLVSVLQRLRALA